MSKNMCIWRQKLCNSKTGVGPTFALIYGQESTGWISLFKLVTFFFFLKIYRNVIFLVKLIGQWIPDGNGNENIFFDIPSNPLPIAVRNSWANQFYQKNNVSLYFQRKKVWQVFPGPFSSLQICTFFVGKYRFINLFWNIFHFQNLTKNGNKVGTIYKVGTLLYISAF